MIVFTEYLNQNVEWVNALLTPENYDRVEPSKYSKGLYVAWNHGNEPEDFRFYKGYEKAEKIKPEEVIDPKVFEAVEEAVKALDTLKDKLEQIHKSFS